MDNPVLQITAVANPVDPYENAAVYQSYIASTQAVGAYSAANTITQLSQFAGTWAGAQLTHAFFYSSLRAKSAGELQTISNNFEKVASKTSSSFPFSNVDIIGMVTDMSMARVAVYDKEMVEETKAMNDNTTKINQFLALQNQGKSIANTYGSSTYTADVDKWLADNKALGLDIDTYRDRLLSSTQATRDTAWTELTSSTGVINGQISQLTNNNTPHQLKLQQLVSDRNAMLTFTTNALEKGQTVATLIIANMKG